MDLNKQVELKNLMKEYFGKQGLLILLGAVKNCGFSSLVGLDRIQKDELIDYLLDKIFSRVVSVNRLPVLRVRLNSIFEE